MSKIQWGQRSRIQRRQWRWRNRAKRRRAASSKNQTRESDGRYNTSRIVGSGFGLGYNLGFGLGFGFGFGLGFGFGFGCSLGFGLGFGLSSVAHWGHRGGRHRSASQILSRP